jgi:tRNA pseudouridine38-40 synthase
MPRYKLIIEYNGCRFSGWQRQCGTVTVQETIEQGIRTIFKTDVCLEGAGRTDAGVHALGQVAHFDMPCDVSAYRVSDGLNHYLRNRGVAILDTEVVPREFHARFCAINRVYEYRILNRRSPAVLEAEQVWHVIKTLDVGKMQAAARRLTGHHDFTSFRATACQAPSPFKTLSTFDIIQEPNATDDSLPSVQGVYIKARVESRSFLHNQVRIMMGTLKLVGEGRFNPEDVTDMLKARSRSASGPTAPPQGLYLKSIYY